MSCHFLIHDLRSAIEYYCRSTAPCPYMHLDIDCPCIKSARHFEESILSDAYQEIRKKTVAETCKDVSVIR